MPRLYLIPTPISENGIDDIPIHTIRSIETLRCFVVENLKTARRVLRKMHYKAHFDEDVNFFEWDKHAIQQDFEKVGEWMTQRLDIGLMSEAGLPCIADPGSEVVRLAHKHNYIVIPLAGPTSIILALIASGFNGQNFAFNGYLPIEKEERIKKIKWMESRLISERQTQLFMETPYRNLSMYDDVIKHCQSHIGLSIAADIGGEHAWIQSKTIAEWRKLSAPSIHKMPTIFSIGLDA